MCSQDKACLSDQLFRKFRGAAGDWDGEEDLLCWVFRQNGSGLGTCRLEALAPWVFFGYSLPSPNPGVCDCCLLSLAVLAGGVVRAAALGEWLRSRVSGFGCV